MTIDVHCADGGKEWEMLTSRKKEETTVNMEEEATTAVYVAI